MSEIKLEVGKTYRNRKGEEVKIVWNDYTDMYPYLGSDGEWFTESGRVDLDFEEAAQDLIEEVPSESTRHTFDIPNGVKKVTVEQHGNRIVVEMVPDKGPKPGYVAERYRIMDYLHGCVNVNNVVWTYEQLCLLIEGYLNSKEDEK